MSIVASLIVRFGEGADSNALVVMEFDSVLNVDAAGDEKSSFYPGDAVFFTIHHDPVLKIGKVKCTHGQIVKQNMVGRDREQMLLFAEEEDEVELSYIPSSAVTPTWYGNQATGLKRTVRTMSISGGVLPAQCLAKYRMAAQLYRINTPIVSLAEDESYPITIVAWMEAA